MRNEGVDRRVPRRSAKFLAADHPNYRPPATLPVELRRPGVPDAVRDWLRVQFGSGVAAVRRLPGASSTAVHLITLANGRDVVLRRYAWPGILEDEPVAARREVDALEFAEKSGLAAPALLAVDIDGADVGDGIPVIVMERLAGHAVASPDVHALAHAAAMLHDVDGHGFGHQYFRWFDDVALDVPRSAQDVQLWEWALEIWSLPVPMFTPVFIHRDLHPGNVLWSRGRLSGIVDWANACRGPSGCDVATCRGDLMRVAGRDCSDAFVAAYTSLVGRPPDPYWEVVSVLEHGPSPWTTSQVLDSEHRLRVARDAMG